MATSSNGDKYLGGFYWYDLDELFQMISADSVLHKYTIDMCVFCSNHSRISSSGAQSSMEESRSRPDLHHFYPPGWISELHDVCCLWKIEWSCAQSEFPT